MKPRPVKVETTTPAPRPAIERLSPEERAVWVRAIGQTLLAMALEDYDAEQRAADRKAG